MNNSPNTPTDHVAEVLRGLTWEQAPNLDALRAAAAAARQIKESERRLRIFTIRVAAAIVVLTAVGLSLLIQAQLGRDAKSPEVAHTSTTRGHSTQGAPPAGPRFYAVEPTSVPQAENRWDLGSFAESRTEQPVDLLWNDVLSNETGFSIALVKISLAARYDLEPSVQYAFKVRACRIAVTYGPERNEVTAAHVTDTTLIRDRPTAGLIREEVQVNPRPAPVVIPERFAWRESPRICTSDPVDSRPLIADARNLEPTIIRGTLDEAGVRAQSIASLSRVQQEHDSQLDVFATLVRVDHLESSPFDLQIHGIPIPSPHSVLPLLGAGVWWYRRRRR